MLWKSWRKRETPPNSGAGIGAWATASLLTSAMLIVSDGSIGWPGWHSVVLTIRTTRAKDFGETAQQDPQ
jgi:hypothetical protein